MKLLPTAVAPIAALCLSSPSASQEATSDIVVTAQMSSEDIDKASHEMARSLTAVPLNDQVPRWARPVCTRVEGLDTPLASRVAATITSIGTAAKIKMAKRGCNPNVFVIFTNESRELAAEIADRLPVTNDPGSRVERAAFTSAKGPLRWETRISVQDATHGPMSGSSAALMSNTDPHFVVDVPVSDSTSSSLIRKQTKASIDGMFVIVDGNAAAGMELAQLAEYVAMVVFARPPMSKPFDAHSSILNLAKHVPPGSNPLRLTEWDRAYLAALYEAPTDRSASATRSIIAQRMTKHLAKDN